MITTLESAQERERLWQATAGACQAVGIDAPATGRPAETLALMAEAVEALAVEITLVRDKVEKQKEPRPR